MDINLNWNPDDINSPVIFNSEIDLFFQEVELAIKINKQQIWNIPEGIDLTNYIFNKYVNEYQIKQEVVSFVSNNCENSKNFLWDCNVKIINSENNEIIVIEFKIQTNDETLTNSFFIN